MSFSKVKKLGLNITNATNLNYNQKIIIIITGKICKEIDNYNISNSACVL